MSAQRINQKTIRAYLAYNARSLDLALYDSFFSNGTTQAVLEELKKFQNLDGGFGHGIEPDFQLPDSSALATTLAFQYLGKIGATEDEPLVKQGVAYFLQTYDRQKDGWQIVPKEVDNYPQAPWWEYDWAITGFGWGNPGAEILGYLLRFRTSVEDGAVIGTITEKALERLRELATTDKPDFHELLCYARLYEQAGPSLQMQLYETLANLITKVVSIDPDEWKAYGATPLTFVKSPESLFISLFDTATIQANLDHLKRTIVGDDHWEPNWDWAGGYPEAWKRAKQEWCGKLTVDNMHVLRAFGELDY